MNYTLSQIKNYFIIKNSGKRTFYASDFGLNGGEINALASGFLISKTHGTKEEWVQISSDKKIRIEVHEWKINSELGKWRNHTVNEMVANILETAKVLKEFGFE